jgi:hypothetical protein
MLTLLALAVAAQSERPARDVHEAVERGLTWLARDQKANGSFGTGSAPVATTAIAGMAFLTGGHLPNRSKYGPGVKKALGYLLRRAGRSGYINEGQARGTGGSGMHGHGYATLFLAECLGTTCGDAEIDLEDLRDALARAVTVIENSQQPSGGWNYEPNDQSFDEGSVTVTQVQALRAARNVGIKVNLRTIEKAIEYINRSTGADGQTAYSLRNPRKTLAITAAGMSVLQFLGTYESPKVKAGLDFILRTGLPKGAGGAPDAGWGSWYFYGTYYATLGCAQAGGAYWKTWWPAIRDDLVRLQSPQGSWNSGRESQSYGEALTTGFALQVLQVERCYSPILQGRDN